MNRKEIIIFLNEIEERFPIAEWKIDNIHIWPLIRIRIASIVDSSSVKKETVSPLLSFLKTRIDRLRLYAAYRKLKARVLTRQTDVLFFSLPHYRTLLKDSWYNKYVDPLIDFLSASAKTSYVIELSDSQSQRSPRYHEDHILNINYFLLYALKEKHSLLGTHSIRMDGYEDFWRFLRLRTKKKIPELSLHRIIDEMGDLLIISEYFQHMLVAMDTRLCIMNCYYHPVAMSLNIACRKANILSVDLQHGSQGNNHAAYGNWKNVPADGYEMLPSIFWCWNETDAKSITSWSKHLHGMHRAIVGGNPFLQFWSDKKNPIVTYYEKEITKSLDKQQNPLVILFSLQPMPDFLPQWILDVVKESPSHWIWWFRLHPNQLKDRIVIKKIFEAFPNNKRIVIDEPTDFPLPVLLQHTDVHVTQFSTVVLEAENFGVSSVVTHQNGVDLYPKQINSKTAIFAGSVSELRHAILLQAGKRGLMSKKTSNNVSIKKIMDQLFSFAKKNNAY